MKTYTLEELVEKAGRELAAANITPVDGRSNVAPTVRDVRYYRTLGLLPPSPKLGGGKRYTDKHLTVMRDNLPDALRDVGVIPGNAAKPDKGGATPKPEPPTQTVLLSQLAAALAEAQSAYNQGQEALKNGNFAAYGDAQTELHFLTQAKRNQNEHVTGTHTGKRFNNVNSQLNKKNMSKCSDQRTHTSKNRHRNLQCHHTLTNNPK